MNNEFFIPFVSVALIMVIVPLFCLNEIAKHYIVTHCRFEMYKMRDILFDRLIRPNICKEEKTRVLSVIQIIHGYLFLVDHWSMLRFRSIIFNPPTPEQIQQNELFISGMDDSLKQTISESTKMFAVALVFKSGLIKLKIIKTFLTCGTKEAIKALAKVWQCNTKIEIAPKMTAIAGEYPEQSFAIA